MSKKYSLPQNTLHITISGDAAGAFLHHACAYAVLPICISSDGNTMHIKGMSVDIAARALAYAAFPAREKQLLQNILWRRRIKKDRRLQLLALAQTAAEEELPLEPLYMGKNRYAALSAEFASILNEHHRLDMEGFCRFRLGGYDTYLRELLAAAEDRLEAAAEEKRYQKLLRAALGQGSGTVTLFFYPQDICQIWLEDKQGLRQLEGGHIKGAEWLLLTNLIALDPALLRIHNARDAAPALLEMLEKVFAERLEAYSSNEEKPSAPLDRKQH